MFLYLVDLTRYGIESNPGPSFVSLAGAVDVEVKEKERKKPLYVNPILPADIDNKYGPIMVSSLRPIYRNPIQVGDSSGDEELSVLQCPSGPIALLQTGNTKKGDVGFSLEPAKRKQHYGGFNKHAGKSHQQPPKGKKYPTLVRKKILYSTIVPKDAKGKKEPLPSVRTDVDEKKYESKKNDIFAQDYPGVKDQFIDPEIAVLERMVQKMELEAKIVVLNDNVDQTGFLSRTTLQNRHIINSNKSRDLLGVFEPVQIDERIYWKNFVREPGEYRVPKLLTVFILVGLIDQLASQMMVFRELSEDNFMVLRSYAQRLLRTISCTAQQELDCVTWAPILAWEKHKVMHALSNPYGEKGYFSRDLNFRGIFDSPPSLYPDRDPMTDNASYLDVTCFNSHYVPTSTIHYRKSWTYWFFSGCSYYLKRIRDIQLRTKLRVYAWRYRIDIRVVDNIIYYRAGARQWQHRDSRYHCWVDLTRYGIEPDPGPDISYRDCVFRRKFVTYDYEYSVPMKSGARYSYPMSFDRRTEKKVDTVRGEQVALLWHHMYAPICYANTLDNERAVLLKRVLCDTPSYDPVVMADFLRFIKANFDQLCNYRVKNIRAVSFDTYLLRSNASPAVKKILAKTYESLRTEGHDFVSITSTNAARKMVRRSLFLKKENLSYVSPLGVKDKAPRAIQGATAEFICIVGPWIMALQDHFKKIWGSGNWLCFTSGVRSDKAASVINVPWSYVEDDVGTFDSSVSVPLLELEVWMCKRFGAPPLVIQLMRLNCNTYGYTFFGAFYECPGLRKSGDPYTSLFNSTLNGFLHVYIIHLSYGWSILIIKHNVRMLVAGDDNVMAINSSKRIDFVYWMGQLGFNSEALYRDSIFDVEFCSCRLYEVRGLLVFGPMPGKVLSKIGYLNSPPDTDYRALLRGIALGLKHNCYFIPPIRAVIDHILFITQGVKPAVHYVCGFHIDEWHMNFVNLGNDDLSVMTSLTVTYGWTYCHQFRFVSHLETQTSMFSPLLYLLFDRDTSGPKVMFVGG